MMNLETIRLLAAYNGKANEGMNEIISGLSLGEWNRVFHGYFPSIHSLCSHIFIGDILWLHRIESLRSFSFSKDALLAKAYSFSDDPFPSLELYLEMRPALDDVFLRLSRELSAAELKQNLFYTNIRGETQSRNLGGLLVHVFNHQTHHRGMISLYLEFLGRENDFSNLYTMV